jgi:hypothetical protein
MKTSLGELEDCCVYVPFVEHMSYIIFQQFRSCELARMLIPGSNKQRRPIKTVGATPYDSVFSKNRFQIGYALFDADPLPLPGG